MCYVDIAAVCTQYVLVAVRTVHAASAIGRALLCAAMYSMQAGARSGILCFIMQVYSVKILKLVHVTYAF
jgi:hypothetical protein